MKPKVISLTTVAEGALILLVGAIGWAAHMPLLFASLGPTAYELVEKPKAPSAKTYNILVGHFAGMGAGFLALWVFSAWSAPKVGAAGFVSSTRLWAAVLAVLITTFVTLILKATQPAAVSTALLVSLGTMQRRNDAIAIVVGVVILALVGEPLRRLFVKLHT